MQPVEDSKKLYEAGPVKGVDGFWSWIVINSASFENLKALFSAPVRMNIKQLRDKTNRLISEGKEFQGMKAKIQALLSEG